MGTRAALAILGDLATGLTATGTTQGTAYAITASTSVFATVPAGTGAILPSAGANDVLTVANHSGTTLMVYPPVGGKINNRTANYGVAMPGNTAVEFRCLDGANYLAMIASN